MAKRGKKMSILTFKGGVHPYDGKELSKDVAVRKILPEGELVFPVSQHIGAPAKPVVEAVSYTHLNFTENSFHVKS